jgi:hypothetical protein
MSEGVFFLLKPYCFRHLNGVLGMIGEGASDYFQVSHMKNGDPIS